MQKNGSWSFLSVIRFLQKKGEIMDTTQKNRENKSLRLIRFYARRIWRDASNLAKWLLLAVLTGLAVGAISSVFARALKFVTDFRMQNLWVFLLLPVSGLCIVFLYQKFGKDDGGTNQVLSTIRSQDDVPLRSAPLIFVSTLLTHLTGGSAGREALPYSLEEVSAISLAPGSVLMKRTGM